MCDAVVGHAIEFSYATLHWPAVGDYVLLNVCMCVGGMNCKQLGGLEQEEEVFISNL